MREIRYTARFKRDYRREKSGRHGKRLDALLTEAVTLLAEDQPLPRRYVDHPLAGEWSDHRDCHLRPDLVLIYRKPDDTSLDLGSDRTASSACRAKRPLLLRHVPTATTSPITQGL